MSVISRSAFQIEKWLQIHAGKHPALFYPMYTLMRGRPQQVVSPESDLVIEGYPRSANSFAVTSLRNAGPSPLRIASHLHVPAQIIRAQQWGIPTLVIIRPPEEAVTSFMLRDPISARQALSYYIAFYGTARRYRRAFTLALFDEVTRDLPAVVRRLNHEAGVQIPVPPSDEASRARIFERIDASYRRSYQGDADLEQAVSRPSAIREERKQALKEDLRNGHAGRLLNQARALYDELVTEQ